MHVACLQCSLSLLKQVHQVRTVPVARCLGTFPLHFLSSMCAQTAGIAAPQPKANTVAPLLTRHRCCKVYLLGCTTQSVQAALARPACILPRKTALVATQHCLCRSGELSALGSAFSRQLGGTSSLTEGTLGTQSVAIRYLPVLGNHPQCQGVLRDWLDGISRLRHPHILPVIGVCLESPAIVCRLMQVGSLLCQ